MIMITPDIWFTLFSLSKKGAIHTKTILTTRELGEMMGISQQTASRRVSFCVDEGFVTRIHTAEGMLLQITDRGRQELIKIMTSLEIAFTPPQDEIVIEGQIVTGLGEGAYYIDVYSTKLRNALGFKPHLGTLNVKVINDESRKAVGRMKNSPPLVLSGFRHKDRTFGDVICYRVKVNDEIEGAVVIAQRTHHSENILEVVAPVDIRSALKLEDDDMVKLTLVPLHLGI
jgi:riboflavin kinase